MLRNTTYFKLNHKQVLIHFYSHTSLCAFFLSELPIINSYGDDGKVTGVKTQLRGAYAYGFNNE